MLVLRFSRFEPVISKGLSAPPFAFSGKRREAGQTVGPGTGRSHSGRLSGCIVGRSSLQMRGCPVRRTCLSCSCQNSIPYTALRGYFPRFCTKAACWSALISDRTIERFWYGRWPQGKTMAGCGPRLKPSLNSIFSKSRKCHRRRVW